MKGTRTQSAREKIEAAIEKIIQDEGVDRGEAVERVKAALLADTEFRRTPWGRDLESILQGEWPAWVPQPGEPTAPLPETEAPRAETITPPAETPTRAERIAQERARLQPAPPAPPGPRARSENPRCDQCRQLG
jgi:hypothetical protein